MTSSSSRPLTSHPAFPVVVALWFAALLGGGTFVLPASVFESMASATGLAEIVPAARPPLGDTARLVISVAAAILGALIGLLIAWQVRRASRPAQDSVLSQDAAHETIRDDDTAPIGHDTHAEAEDASAWQVWREQMTEDTGNGDDRDSEDDPYDPADALVRDPIVDDEGAFVADSGDDLDRLDAAREAEPADLEYYDDAANGIISDGPTIDSDADDPQRAEADRLVAGLARMRREDGENRTRMAEPPSIAAEDDALDEPLSFKDESEDGSIFDSSFVSAAPMVPTEELGAEPDDTPDQERKPEPEPEPEPEPQPRPRPRSDRIGAPTEPLASLSLPGLVARLELAIEARRRGAAETPSEEDDSQSMLRAALDKLDQVGRKP